MADGLQPQDAAKTDQSLLHFSIYIKARSKIEVKYHLCLKTRIIVDIPKILQRPQKVAYVKCLSGVR